MDLAINLKVSVVLLALDNQIYPHVLYVITETRPY